MQPMPWPIQKGLLRAKQKAMKVALRLMTLPVPELLVGAGMAEKLPEIVRRDGIENVLVVSDRVLMGMGVLDPLFDALKKNGLQYSVFDDVQPNPTIQNVEAGLKTYLANRCEGIIAFGGGSPMDCAKVIGVRAAHPDKTIRQLSGWLKIKKPIPPLYAIPTTAGSGSEATIAAVILDVENHEKFGVGDAKLIPKWAVLDPALTVSLPPHVTAATGMDALTHAVETYLSLFATAFTDEYAEKATMMILQNIETAYTNGTDVAARQNMLMASHYAGLAFTRALVGYVHAVAHNMGGLYNIPHGLANATILPHVLEYSRKKAQKKLARLAALTGLGNACDVDEARAQRFIDHIKQMNQNMGIPTGFKEIQEEDIPLIVKRTMAEAALACAPPRMMGPKECEAFIRQLMKR